MRRDHYDVQVNTNEEHRLLHDLLSATQGIEITWFTLDSGSPLAGQTLAAANLRARTGASIARDLRAATI